MAKFLTNFLKIFAGKIKNVVSAEKLYKTLRSSAPLREIKNMVSAEKKDFSA
ncbi:MAG: hypothetical protein K2K81_00490 [Muribaculaceae bacterium]|nr:hypothetical protein [Muribaculaceae bacterium]